MTINKFSTKRYGEQSQQFSLSFDLLRHAVTELKGQGIRRFMEKMRLPEINKLNKARILLQKVPKNCIWAALKIYPDYFSRI